MKHKYIFSLGSNLGDREENLISAINKLNLISSIVTISQTYRTKSLLNDKQSDYYNKVIEVETEFDVEEFFDKIKSIEKSLGRVDNGRWRSRIIDIDILDYDEKKYISDRLEIPHKEMSRRSFVLYPLRDIKPHYKNLSTGATVDEMIAELEDDLHIIKL